MCQPYWIVAAFLGSYGKAIAIWTIVYIHIHIHNHIHILIQIKSLCWKFWTPTFMVTVKKICGQIYKYYVNLYTVEDGL